MKSLLRLGPDLNDMEPFFDDFGAGTIFPFFYAFEC